MAVLPPEAKKKYQKAVRALAEKQRLSRKEAEQLIAQRGPEFNQLTETQKADVRLAADAAKRPVSKPVAPLKMSEYNKMSVEEQRQVAKEDQRPFISTQPDIVEAFSKGIGAERSRMLAEGLYPSWKVAAERVFARQTPGQFAAAQGRAKGRQMVARGELPPPGKPTPQRKKVEPKLTRKEEPPVDEFEGFSPGKFKAELKKTAIMTAPSSRQQAIWETEARDMGVDPLAYSQEKWLAIQGLTREDLRKEGRPLPELSQAKITAARSVIGEVSRAQVERRQRQAKVYNKALDAVKGFKDKEGKYDLVAAIEAGVPKSVLKEVFASKDLAKAKTVLKAQGLPGRGMTLSAGLEEAVTTIPAQEKKVSIPKSIWRALTPWVEERGGTFIGFIKATPKRLTGQIQLPQGELALQYKAERDAPLWARLLFGQTIAYDPVRKQYAPIIIAKYPLVRKGKVPGQAAKQLTKTIEVNWNKLLKPSVTKPKIDWNKLTEAIEKGQVKNARDAGRWAKSTASKTVRGKPQTAEQLAAQRKAFEAGREASSKSQQIARMQEWTKVERFLTKAGMQKLLGQYESMRPAEALKWALKRDLFVAAIAINPRESYRILQNVSGGDRAEALKSLDRATKQAIEARELAQASEAAIRELDLRAKEMAIARTAGESAAKALAKGETKGQAKALALAEVKAQAMALTNTETQTRVLTDAKPLTATAMQLALQPEILPILAPTPTPAPQLALAPAPTPLPSPVHLPSPVREPFIPPRRGQSDKDKRKAISDSDGAIAWRQGELGGKDVWHVIMHPYMSKRDYVTVLGRKPPNSTIVKGPKSAYQTVKLLYGDAPPKKVTGDIGFMDFLLEPKGKKKVGIGFKPDSKQETTGDITIGKTNPPITERPLRLPSRGKITITPKRRRLR